MRCTTNYSSRLQQFGIFVCLGLLLAAAGAQRAVADDASVTVSTTSTDQIVLPGTAVTVDASAMFVAPTTPPAANETIVSVTPLTYTWTATYGTPSPSGGTSSSAGYTYGDPASDYSETLTCKVKYTETDLSTDPYDGPGSPQTTTTSFTDYASGSITVDITVQDPQFTVTVNAPGSLGPLDIGSASGKLSATIVGANEMGTQVLAGVTTSPTFSCAVTPIVSAPPAWATPVSLSATSTTVTATSSNTTAAKDYTGTVTASYSFTGTDGKPYTSSGTSGNIDINVTHNKIWDVGTPIGTDLTPIAGSLDQYGNQLYTQVPSTMAITTPPPAGQTEPSPPPTSVVATAGQSYSVTCWERSIGTTTSTAYRASMCQAQ